jgi:hypothetical protein
VPAPRAVHVRVYLRDSGRPGSRYEYRGLFTAVEQVDRAFLKRHFAQGAGTLYKGCFGMAGGRWGQPTSATWHDECATAAATTRPAAAAPHLPAENKQEKVHATTTPTWRP